MSKHVKKSDSKTPLKLALIIVLILIISVFLIKKNQKTETIKYEKTQILLNNKNITEQLKKDLIVNENDQVYMSIEDIKEQLDKTIYKEEETGTIITTCNKKIAVMSEENNDYITINGSKQSVKNPVIQSDGKLYIAISEMENVYNYQFNYAINTNMVIIDSLNKKSIKAYAKKDIKVKNENKAFSTTIEKIKKGTWVIYIEDESGIAKIRTQNGNIGYVNKKYLDNFVTEREDYDEKSNKTIEQTDFEYDVTNEDITTYKKREEIINSILQEMIKNDKMNVKIIYNGESNSNYDRFKIEVTPILTECGITVYF